MFIKSIILDGFKSYGKRTEIKDFDSEFTAITGLNGTGKSNILDSICFVLGINKLEQVIVEKSCKFRRTYQEVAMNFISLLANIIIIIKLLASFNRIDCIRSFAVKFFENIAVSFASTKNFFDLFRCVPLLYKNWCTKMDKPELRKLQLPLFSIIPMRIAAHWVTRSVKRYQ